jgi:hypothetical protein
MYSHFRLRIEGHWVTLLPFKFDTFERHVCFAGILPLTGRSRHWCVIAHDRKLWVRDLTGVGLGQCETLLVLSEEKNAVGFPLVSRMYILCSQQGSVLRRFFINGTHC